MIRRISEFSENYRGWLYGTMNFEGYSRLFNILHDVEFVWKLPLDENRESDGRHLRVLYENVSGCHLPDEDLDYPASFLEVLIALAYTMDSVIYSPENKTYVSHWLWLMLDNMGIADCDDDWYDSTVDASLYILSRVDDVMLRRYEPSGEGGIFPMRYKGVKDQRTVELWYQLNEYILQYDLL